MNKFKIGDTVCVVKRGAHAFEPGVVGIIVLEKNPRSEGLVLVRDDGGQRQWLRHDEIENTPNPAERIAKLEAELASLKAELNKKPVQSSLNRMLDAYHGEWSSRGVGIYSSRGVCLGNTSVSVETHGHKDALGKAIAALPKMVNALRAVRDCVSPHHTSAVHPRVAQLVLDALVAAGDEP